MADRIGLLTVALERDLRDDEVERLKMAIRHFRGVLSVTGMVSDANTHLAMERVKSQVFHTLCQTLTGVGNPPNDVET
jgi:hypothetical protein